MSLFHAFSVLFIWFVSHICMQLHRKSIEIEDQTACFWWRKAMLLRNDNWRKSVISSMIMRCEKREFWAFFRSDLPLFANTRVLRVLVKIFRSLLVAAHFLSRFLERGVPSHPYTKFAIVPVRSGNHPLSVLSSHCKRWCDACVVSVADVSCIDGLGKEAVAPDNTAVCALMRGGAIRKEKCIY